MTTAAPVHPVAPAETQAVVRTRARIASFPPVLRTNPYQRLLYDQLARIGLDLADGARLTLPFLLRSRRDVQVLHFHWPQSYWRPGSSFAWAGPVGAAAKRALFALRLAAARAVGYRIVWT